MEVEVRMLPLAFVIVGVRTAGRCPPRWQGGPGRPWEISAAEQEGQLRQPWETWAWDVGLGPVDSRTAWRSDSETSAVRCNVMPAPRQEVLQAIRLRVQAVAVGSVCTRGAVGVRPIAVELLQPRGRHSCR